MRQSFLDGSLTRLLDPDATLRTKIVEFVGKGDFGFASGQKPDGTYERVWFREPVGPDEVDFESGVFLLTRARVEALRAGEPKRAPDPGPVCVVPEPEPGPEPEPEPQPKPGVQPKVIRLVGAIPPEVWNRVGTKVLPKLRSVSSNLELNVELTFTVDRERVGSLTSELRQILADLGLGDRILIHGA